MQRTCELGMIATTLLALSTIASPALADNRHDNRREWRQDSREIRHDRRELRYDYRELARDRADYRRAQGPRQRRRHVPRTQGNPPGQARDPP